MKSNPWQLMVVFVAVSAVNWLGATALAQGSSAASPASPPTAGAPAPQLAFGMPQILQLTQAKVGDDMIIAYIKNSGNRYGLTAEQIIYLRQQGVSDAVVMTMLNQPKPGLATFPPAVTAPPPLASPAYAGPVPATPAPPPVTYVQTAPDSADYSDAYYSEPYYYPPVYYPPTYAWYPPVVYYIGGGRVSLGGWHGGWHGGAVGGGRIGGGGGARGGVARSGAGGGGRRR